MDRRSLFRFFFSALFACLLVASISGPALRAGAEQLDETGTPTLEDPSATLEETDPPSPTEEIPSETPTTRSEIVPGTDAPAATSVPSAAPTTTKHPAPHLRGNYVANEILVRFKNSATEDGARDCLRQINGEITSTINEISVAVVQIDSLDVSNAVALLSACPAVRYVEPNYLAFVTDTIPSDTNWGLQYGLVNIRAPQGWDSARGSASVTIAIVDTGVDLGHPDLVAKIVGGHDFVNNDAIAQDDNGHGTHVAGIAAATTNNGSGVAGVSWGARIMPVKVLNAAGGGTFADVAAGITWAADHGAQIINLSVGGPSSSLALQNAVNYAVGQGVLIVAATGNTGSNAVLFPAAYPNVLAVGATDAANNLAGFSNFGPEVDLVAPGVSIYSTNPGGYGYRSGTSMATPFVSGLAAILRGIPGNSAGIVRLIMESTALDLGPGGWDSFYGSGLIQMDAAIQLALPPPAGPNPINHTPFVFGPGGYSLTATFTPTVTMTFTPPVSAPESETPTLTLQPSGGIDTDTPTPEIIALETQTASGFGSFRGRLFPCCGLLLILLGIFLLWYASRRKGRAQAEPYHWSSPRRN